MPGVEDLRVCPRLMTMMSYVKLHVIGWCKGDGDPEAGNPTNVLQGTSMRDR